MKASPSSPFVQACRDFFFSRATSSALTTLSLGAVFSVHLLISTIGWGGYLAIIVGLVILQTATLITQRRELEWHGILPISVLGFMVWSALSIVWTSYQSPSVSITSVMYQIAIAFLALAVALLRDLIQIMRSLGDVLRVLLSVSLALEILSGLLLDLPIAFLEIEGKLGSAGPIQGVFGSRNMMGFVAVVAVVTFVVERTTNSVSRTTSGLSIALATGMLVLSRSPISLGVAIVVAVAAAAILALRKVKPEMRRILQLAMLLVAIIAAVNAYLAQSRILAFFGARAEFNYRRDLWSDIAPLFELHPIEGWGWAGLWRGNVSPFFALNVEGARNHTSALNAFVDVAFQLGIVGLVIFVGMVGLSFVRAWILATSKKSIIYMWPALIFSILIATSLAESVILVQYGWMLFVICAVKTAHFMSWRQGLALAPEAGTVRD